MFMKHYAPNRCGPSIEALNFGGGGEGSGQMYISFFFFFFGGGGVGGGGLVRGGGVRVDVNGELKFL